MTSNITKNHKVGIFAIFIASALILGAGRQPLFQALTPHLQQQVAANRNEAIRTDQANQANIGSQGQKKEIRCGGE